MPDIINTLKSIPTITYCEHNITHLVNQPFNTITNLPFVIVGLFIFLKKRREAPFLIYSLILIFVGIASGLYHVTYMFYGQLLDLVSMFFLSTFYVLISYSHLKNNNLNFNFSVLLVISLALSLTTFIPVFGIPQTLFYVFVISALLMEILATKKYKIIKVTDLVTGIILVFAGLGFWALDTKGAWCPTYKYLLNGHGIWHMLTGLAVFYIYKHLNNLPVGGRVTAEGLEPPASSM
jgi:hypothetical protein